MTCVELSIIDGLLLSITNWQECHDTINILIKEEKQYKGSTVDIQYSPLFQMST